MHAFAAACVPPAFEAPAAPIATAAVSSRSCEPAAGRRVRRVAAAASAAGPDSRRAAYSPSCEPVRAPETPPAISAWRCGGSRAAERSLTACGWLAGSSFFERFYAAGLRLAAGSGAERPQQAMRMTSRQPPQDHPPTERPQRHSGSAAKAAAPQRRVYRPPPPPVSDFFPSDLLAGDLLALAAASFALHALEPSLLPPGEAARLLLQRASERDLLFWPESAWDVFFPFLPCWLVSARLHGSATPGAVSDVQSAAAASFHTWLVAAPAALLLRLVVLHAYTGPLTPAYATAFFAVTLSFAVAWRVAYTVIHLSRGQQS
eukprot:tig00020723_g13491.t1